MPHIVTFAYFKVYRQVSVCVCVCVICTWHRTSREIRLETYAKMRAFDSEQPLQCCMTIIIIILSYLIVCRQAAPAGMKIHNTYVHTTDLIVFLFSLLFFHGNSLWIEIDTHVGAYTIVTRVAANCTFYYRIFSSPLRRLSAFIGSEYIFLFNYFSSTTSTATSIKILFSYNNTCTNYTAAVFDEPVRFSGPVDHIIIIIIYNILIYTIIACNDYVKVFVGIDHIVIIYCTERKAREYPISGRFKQILYVNSGQTIAKTVRFLGRPKNG